MKAVGLILLVVFAAGCAMKTKILDTAAISTTHQSLKPGEKLEETGPVSGQFCMDMWNDKGQKGMLDETVKNAQAQHQVDFILNASLWREGQCLTIEGTGARVASNSSQKKKK